VSGGRRQFLPADPEEEDFAPKVPLRRRLADGLIIGGLVVVVVVGGIVGMGLLGQFLSGIEIAVTDVEPETCFNTSGEISEDDFPNISVADCAGAHRGEVIARYSWPDPEAAFPGEAAIDAFLRLRCLYAFREYVGTEYASSELEMASVYPTSADWGRGAKMLSCVVFGSGGEHLTGSVRDSRR
jgi:hypothetical protein